MKSLFLKGLCKYEILFIAYVRNHCIAGIGSSLSAPEEIYSSSKGNQPGISEKFIYCPVPAFQETFRHPEPVSGSIPVALIA
jgi:hypothetical protein